MKNSLDALLWTLGAGAASVAGYFIYRAVREGTAVADTQAALPAGASMTSAPSSSGPNPFLNDFTAAAVTAGVPIEWATDPSLVQLVKHESAWKPDAKNPNSTAFGLFQFIKTTWATFLPEVPYGTVDAYWQAVGGFRYIQKRYGSPDRAWGFWQATVKKQDSFAPADLQARAQQWIAKNWAGY